MSKSLGSSYWKLWAASVVSNLGDGISVVAYPWLDSALTMNPLHIAAVTVVSRLPWLLFSLPSGVITDRVDRRRLVAAMDVFHGAPRRFRGGERRHRPVRGEDPHSTEGMMAIGSALGGALVALAEPVLGREWALRAPYIVAAIITLGLFVYALPRLNTARIEEANDEPRALHFAERGCEPWVRGFPRCSRCARASGRRRGPRGRVGRR